MSHHPIEPPAVVVQLAAYRATQPPEPVSSPRESVCRLAAALRTFGRELRAYAGAWLRAHRIGYVERANFDGYVDGYRDGLAADPRRSG